MSGDTDCAKQVLSAGFLFYSHPPDSDNIYILLGMDDYNGKWSDFGGRRNPNEPEVDCAIREMLEETLYTVQIFDNEDDKPTSISQYTKRVKQMVESRNYTYRIGLDITPKREKQTVVYEGFNPNTLSVYYVCPFTHMELTPCQQSNQLLKRLRVCYVKYIPWQPHLPELFSKTYCTLYQLQSMPTLEKKVRFWQSMPPELQYHPALVLERSESTLEITNITVLKEWMEKQQIAWWSLPRLKNALKNGGRYRKHVLRYGFLSTLGIVVERLSCFMQSNHQSSQFSCVSDDNNFLEEQAPDWRRKYMNQIKSERRLMCDMNNQLHINMIHMSLTE